MVIKKHLLFQNETTCSEGDLEKLSIEKQRQDREIVIETIGLYVVCGRKSDMNVRDGTLTD